MYRAKGLSGSVVFVDILKTQVRDVNNTVSVFLMCGRLVRY